MGIYLGRRVRDIGIRGLSNAKEFREIADKIYEDYKRGRISKRTARGRLLLLYKLSFKKNNSNLRVKMSTLVRIRKYIKSIINKL